jgi:hypothetical protein
MSGWQRFWIGGGGALLPLLVTLLAVDISGIIDHAAQYTVGTYVGVGLRYIILFALGGIIAALNSDEQKPIKLVQLGIAAPALVASYVNAQTANANPPPPKPAAPVQTPGTTGFLNFVSPANATEQNGSERRPIVLAGGFFADVLQGLSTPLSGIGKESVRPQSDTLQHAINQATQSAAQAERAAKQAEAAAKKAAADQSIEAIEAAKTSSAEAVTAASKAKTDLEILKTTTQK